RVRRFRRAIPVRPRPRNPVCRRRVFTFVGDRLLARTRPARTGALSTMDVHLRNARLLIALAALRQVLFAIPVITLFWRRQLGMTLADVMLLQAIFALAVTVCELPSGYLADRMGYRRSLLVASALWVVGWGVYALAGTFLA